MFEIGTDADLPDLRPDDILTTATEIQVGDVVCFKRTGPDAGTLRALTEAEQAGCGGTANRTGKTPEGNVRRVAVGGQAGS